MPSSSVECLGISFFDCWPVASPVKRDRTLATRIPYIGPIIHQVPILLRSHCPISLTGSKYQPLDVNNMAAVKCIARLDPQQNSQFADRPHVFQQALFRNKQGAWCNVLVGALLKK
jgi:hypothetical protein